MAKSKSLNHLYTDPLPVCVSALPPLIIYNPLSVAYFLWHYLFPKVPARDLYKASVGSDGTVTVTDPRSIDGLWSKGFFGKGTLSRSEPTWYVRTARRLGLEGGDVVTAEDITEARRRERQKFKAQRAKAEQQELERRRQLDAAAGSTPVSAESSDLPSEDTKPASEASDPVENETTVHPDVEVNDGKLVQQEFLQLMPQEALFLVFIGALDVGMSTKELFDKFVGLFGPKFVTDYIAYHHFRSRGWCVRSGVKFGTDLLLYRRGPPFSHAEFAVMVMDRTNEMNNPWWWNSGVGRVVGGVKKTMVFCYVDTPTDLSLDLATMLRTSYVREIVYRRWVPAKNRD